MRVARLLAAALLLVPVFASASELSGVSVKSVAGCTIPGTPVARWRMEESSVQLIDETANNNDTTSNTGCSQDTTNFIEGSSSWNCAGGSSNEGFDISNAGQSSNMPGKTGASAAGITAIAWVRPENAFDSETQRVIRKSGAFAIGMNTTPLWSVFVQVSVGGFLSVSSDGGTNVDDPVADTFHCVAVSWADDADDTSRLCVDSGSGVGCKDSSSTGTGIVGVSSSVVTLFRNDSAAQEFDGSVDHLAIWDVQLTDSEIQTYCDCTDGS